MRAIVTPAGSLTIANLTFCVALGRGGVSSDKREGDGATPAGLLPLRAVLYRSDRLPAPESAVPARPLGPSDGWCDDARHAAYNRPVQHPFDASAEVLWRDDAVYDIIGILGWNDDPVQPGRGSAIFLHVARPDYAATEGCIALAPDDLRRTLSLGLTEILVTA
jgi:L,D-peptidoglycan transpeptidase YkuD (ErfK/YbiS/YcfS/YnhG family)